MMQSAPAAEELLAPNPGLKNVRLFRRPVAEPNAVVASLDALSVAHAGASKSPSHGEIPVQPERDAAPLKVAP